MLIPSDKHRKEDLDFWRRVSVVDVLHGKTLEKKERKAIDSIKSFIGRKKAWCSTSWGKDSVVSSHLCWLAQMELGISIPLGWIRVEPIANPHCRDVRDVFLKTHPGMDYQEIEIWCWKDEHGWHAKGTLEKGIKELKKRMQCDCHISGVRAEESADRKRRMLRWGPESLKTLAPIGWWTAQDVFGYLAWKDLPINATYVMNGGGRWDRKWIRVASLTGQRGNLMGRAEWEKEYFQQEITRMNVME